VRIHGFKPEVFSYYPRWTTDAHCYFVTADIGAGGFDSFLFFSGNSHLYREFKGISLCLPEQLLTRRSPAGDPCSRISFDCNEQPAAQKIP